MPVLNTTSPTVRPGAPSGRPSNSVPSSRARMALMRLLFDLAVQAVAPHKRRFDPQSLPLLRRKRGRIGGKQGKIGPFSRLDTSPVALGAGRVGGRGGIGVERRFDGQP